MVRDESHNIRSNLPLWGTFFDAFVVAIDKRTQDDTIKALEDTIDVPMHIFEYDFEGFGPARTLVFEKAWEHFPHITHVMVADPDWKPNMALINKSDLNFDFDTYQFKIWDRSGITTRNTNWLMRHQEGLYFDYYVHEFLRFPNGGPYVDLQKALTWEVSEVESDFSWHQTVGHGSKSGASRSYKRLQFDLSLLTLEQADPRYKNSPHTLYYLGAAHCALVESSEDYKIPFLFRNETLTPTQRSHAEGCKEYLTKRVTIHPDAPEMELTWSALRWLAYGQFYLLQNNTAAEYWYGKCVEFDRERVDCKIELSKLYTMEGKHALAYRHALEAVLTPYPDRSFSNNFYIYDCVVPLQTSRAAINLLIGNKEYNDGVYSLGHHMGIKAGRNCLSGIPLEHAGVLDDLGKTFDTVFHSTQDTSLSPPTNTFRCMKEDGSLESRALMATDGKHYICAESQIEIESDGGSNTLPTSTDKCSRFTKRSEKVHPPFHPTSIPTPGHFYDILHNLQPPTLTNYRALFLSTPTTASDSIRAACEFASLQFSTSTSVYVALGGSEDPNMWDAFLAEVQQCNDCKAGISNLDLQAIFLGPSFSISTKFSKNTMDYVDVGAGMMNSAEVVDVPALLREVKSVLGPRGGAGFLLHFVEEEFAGKIKAFKKALTRQPISTSTALELSNLLVIDAIGYASPSLAAKITLISRSFNADTAASLMVGADLKIVNLSTTDNYLSFYATPSSYLPQPLPNLPESTLLLPRSPYTLDSVHRAILRYNQDSPLTITPIKFSFPPYTFTLSPLTSHLIASTLKASTVLDAYKSMLEYLNRQAAYLQRDDTLTLTDFLEEAAKFVEEFSAHNLVTTGVS